MQHLFFRLKTPNMKRIDPRYETARQAARAFEIVSLVCFGMTFLAMAVGRDVQAAILLGLCYMAHRYVEFIAQSPMEVEQ